MPPRDPDGHRVGVYNADNGRPVEGPRDIVALVRDYDLDIGMIVEAGGYVKQVRRELRPTHKVLTGRGSLARRDSMLIVRRRLRPTKTRRHDLNTGGWERALSNRGKGLHPSRYTVSSLVGLIRYAPAHLPPGPHDAPHLPLRRLAHARGLAKLRRLTGRWERQQAGLWVIGGDFNAPATRPDMKSWLAQVDADAAPRNRIDYLIASDGLRISNVRRVAHGTGDHSHAVIADITVK